MLDFDFHNHRPLRELVYEELKRQIMVGEITPGTRMMEVDLAENMGVSRTPIREAIRKLEKEGLVTIEPRHGAYASDISFVDMEDSLEVRQCLEGMAAGLAAQNATDEEKDELIKAAEAYNRAIENGDVDEIISLDASFHKHIVNCSGNKTLIQMMSQIQDASLRFRYIFYEDFSRFKQQPIDHKVIVDAILAGDIETARAEAFSHIEKLRAFVMEEGRRKRRF